MALFTFLCILTQGVFKDINYLWCLLSKDPPFSTGLAQPEDLNTKNYEELKIEQYGGEKTHHIMLTALWDYFEMARHFETQLNK